MLIDFFGGVGYSTGRVKGETCTTGNNSKIWSIISCIEFYCNDPRGGQISRPGRGGHKDEIFFRVQAVIQLVARHTGTGCVGRLNFFGREARAISLLSNNMKFALKFDPYVDRLL